MPDSSLIDRISQALIPYVRTEAQQLDLVSGALNAYPEVIGKVLIGGASEVFARRCVNTLLEYGLLPDGTHPLARVLQWQCDQLGQTGIDWDGLIAEVYAHAGTAAPSRQRAAELAYLDSLYHRQQAKFSLDRATLFVPPEGEASVAKPILRPRLNPRVRIDPVLEHLLPPDKEDADARRMQRDVQPVLDVLAKLRELHRVVVLGDPGQGKSTVLEALADALAQSARADAAHDCGATQVTARVCNREP